MNLCLLLVLLPLVVLMGLAMLMTAMPTVHAIPHVVAARPGVVTYKDLPLITAVGCIRT